jgi:RHS repeat-associated protein
VLATPSGATFNTGGTLSATAIGTYTATATATGNYTGSNSSLTWQIIKGGQSIAFPNPGAQVYGFPVTIRATATSGLPVSLEVVAGGATLSRSIVTASDPSCVVTATRQGNVTIRASQSGDVNYDAAISVDNIFLFENHAPSDPTLTYSGALTHGSNGELATYVGGSTRPDGSVETDGKITLRAEITDVDGNLATHTLSYRHWVNSTPPPYTPIPGTNGSVPTNGSDSIKIVEFGPSATGRWDFHTHGSDGLINPEGFQLTLWVYGGNNDSEFVSQTLNGSSASPQVLNRGQTSIPASITLRNIGDRAWQYGVSANSMDNHPHSLRPVGGDSGAWGVQMVPVEYGKVVHFGTEDSSYTFNFSVTAPTTPGIYSFQWRMMEAFVNNPSYFGAVTPAITVKVPPPAPAGLVANSVTHNSLILSWGGTPGVSFWEVRKADGSVTTTTAPSLAVSDLGADSTYRFSVRAAAGADNYSPFSDELQVTTDLDPAGDTDGDGMTNKWERDHGFNPRDASDALVDTDGDGFSNYVEFQYGSDPRSVNGAPPLVSSLPGEFAVDNKGAANYSIPLAIPPGRQGMQPKLSLVYNSQSGNGVLGVGFSLATGFPQSITRGRSILARDGAVRGADFSSNDKFYLDGKRLICVGGNYGEPGSAYRTEVDSFVTVTTSGTGSDSGTWNIETFVVTDKSGTKMHFGKYGADTDGYQAGGGESQGRAYTYALKRVEDALGNCISFFYTSYSSGEYALTSIKYTGSGATEGAQTISLVYDTTRPDKPVTYVAKREFGHAARLNRIFASVGSDQSSIYDFYYEVPQFTYTPKAGAAAQSIQSGRSRLVSIQPQFRGENGIFSPAKATLFKWSDLKQRVVSAERLPDPDQNGGANIVWGDYDGDGRDDAKRYKAHEWGTCHYSGDFDGDGKKEIATLDLAGLPNCTSGYPTQAVMNGLAFSVTLSGSGLTASIPNAALQTCLREPNNGTGLSLGIEAAAVAGRITIGDFNGDGCDDVLINAYDGYAYVFRSTGSTFEPPLKSEAVVGGSSSANALWYGYGYHVSVRFDVALHYFVKGFPCDVNGDGRTDYAVLEISRPLIGYEGDTVTDAIELRSLCVAMAAEDGHLQQTTMINHFAAGPNSSRAYKTLEQAYCGAMPGDFNGDGLTDFLVLDRKQSDGTRWVLCQSRGSSDGKTAMFDQNAGVIPNTVSIDGTTLETSFLPVTRGYWGNNKAPDDLYNPRSWMFHIAQSLESAAGTASATAWDVNHDGLADYVWYVANEKSVADAPGGGWAMDTSTPLSGWWAYLSTGKFTGSTTSSAGSGFVGPVRLNFLDNVGGGRPYPNSGSNFTSVNLNTGIDYNGDGHSDIFWQESTYGPGDHRVYLMEETATNSFADVLEQVTDGLGRTTEVAYKAAKDDSVYTPGAAVSYPIRELRASTPVVAEVYKDSGSVDTANRAHFSYQYSGNRLDLSGRGALGFHSFVTLDRQTNLFKYQFLAQSFPMTGLTAREQTYRYWESGSNVAFRLVNSHDNTVVFDEVVNPASATAWGTVYPFISKAIEYRWEDATTAHFTYTKAGSPESKPEALFTAARPAGHHIAISAESLFDNQTAVQTTIPGAYKASDRTTDWASAGTNTVTGSASYGAFHSLFDATGYRKITYGNLKQLSTNFGDGFTESVATNYYTPSEVGGLTGLVKDVATTVSAPAPYNTDADTKAPIKRYTYSQIGGKWTPLVATEKVDATDDAFDLTTTYNRDTLGRVTSTEITGANLNSGSAVLGSISDSAKAQHIGSFTTAKTTAFDPKWDQPTSSENAYNHTTTIAYHPFLGLPTSVTGPNNDTVTTTYDALGRKTKVRDELKGLETTTEYAWTLAGANGWPKTQTVTPPSGVTGIASDSGIAGVSAITAASVYAIRTTATVQPPVTAYYDRLGRVIRTVKEGFAGQTAVTDTVYNTLGQAIATSLPYDPAKPATGPFWTTTTYDALGRVSTVTAPNGTVTTNTYTGRCTTVSVKATDRAAQANTTYVDAKGRTIKVWNADNTPSSLNPSTGSSTTASIEYVLDGFGRMRRTILQGDDTAEHRIEASYDALGRQLTLNDPDKGNWSYVNNALGHVVKQTDAKGTVTLSSFDRLGRPLSRKTTETVGPVETADWYYYDFSTDSTRHTVGHVVGSSDRGWIGAPQRETCSTSSVPGYGDPGTASVHYYDTMGRPYLNLNQVDGKYFYTAHDYDTYSRPSAVRYFWRPAGHEDAAPVASNTPYYWNDWGYTYTYDSESYLLTLQDTASTPRTWWQAAGYDHLDRPVTVCKGNGLWTSRTYRATDGLLTAIKTGPTVGSTDIQNLGFTYDGLGNLTGRTGAASESFTYDSLNRLTSGDVTYAANGNITTKKGVDGSASGTYTYSPSKPHAVTAAFGYTYTYDDNGNLLTRTGGGHTWSTKWAGFDKPRWLADTTATGTKGSEFTYNANRSRVVHLEFDAMSAGAPSHYTRKKVYGLGPQLEADYANATSTGAPDWKLQKIRIYVPGPEGIVGTMEFNPRQSFDKAETALVYHYDHLGSIERITPYGSTSTSDYALDGAGKQSRYSYDAWGQRRDPLDWSDAPATTADGGSDDASPRGFTGHEMLDDLGLVHMNGRIYDPLLGRFLSADLVIQNPASLQDFNRYSYVRNNPLSLTDPSGWEYAPPMFVQSMQAAFVMGQGKEYMAAQSANGAAGAKSLAQAGVGMIPYVGTAVGVHQDIQDLRDPGSSRLSKVIAVADLALVAVTLGAESTGGERRAVTSVIHEAQAAEKTLRTEAHAAEQVVKQEANTISHEASNLKQGESAAVDAKQVEASAAAPAQEAKLAEANSGAAKVHGNSASSTEPSGNYTNTHESGKTYSGVGDKKRAADSGERIAAAHDDPLVSTEHAPAPDRATAYRREDKAIQANGGAGNTDKNYNKINSPGRKLNAKGVPEPE